jgi:hypothetical protein
MGRLRKIYEENTLIDKMHRPEKKVILLMAKWSPIAVTIQKLLDFHAKKFKNCKFYYVDIDEFDNPKRFFDFTTVPILKCIDKDGDLVSQKATASNKNILKLISDLNDHGFEKTRQKIDMRRFSKDPKEIEAFIKNREANPIEIIEEDYFEEFEDVEEEDREVKARAPSRRSRSKGSNQEPHMQFEDPFTSEQIRKKRRRERKLQNERMMNRRDGSEEGKKKIQKSQVSDFEEDRRRTMQKMIRKSRPHSRSNLDSPNQSGISLDLNSIIKSREKRKKRLEKERKRENELEKMLKLDKTKSERRRRRSQSRSPEKEDDEDDIIMDSETESENEYYPSSPKKNKTSIRKGNRHKGARNNSEKPKRSVKSGRWKRMREEREDQEDPNLLELGFARFEKIESKIRTKKKKTTTKEVREVNDSDDEPGYKSRSKSARKPKRKERSEFDYLDHEAKSRSTSRRRRRMKDRETAENVQDIERSRRRRRQQPLEESEEQDKPLNLDNSAIRRSHRRRQMLNS